MKSDLVNVVQTLVDVLQVGDHRLDLALDHVLVLGLLAQVVGHLTHHLDLAEQIAHAALHSLQQQKTQRKC